MQIVIWASLHLGVTVYTWTTVSQHVAPEQVSFTDGVGDGPVCPVEDRNAVVIDEMQQPAEPVTQLRYEHLRHADHAVEWRIDKLKYLLQHLVVARQRVLQLYLPTHPHARTDTLCVLQTRMNRSRVLQLYLPTHTHTQTHCVSCKHG